MKFSPLSQGNTNYATYTTVKDALIQQIQKTFKGGQDIAKSLKEMKKFDFTKDEPTREISTETDDKLNELEQTGLDIKYQEKLRRHLDKADAAASDWPRAFALIYSNYCTKAMQSRIDEHPDFNDKIDDDPIALLEAIQALMHDPIRAQYPMASMTDALARFINIKQLENEELTEYVNRFKQTKDVAKTHLGTAFLDEFITHQADYKASS